MELKSRENLKAKIFTFRGTQVILDRDLAELYQVEVKRLNEQVKRNIERFPEYFMFQLNTKKVIAQENSRTWNIRFFNYLFLFLAKKAFIKSEQSCSKTPLTTRVEG